VDVLSSPPDLDERLPGSCPRRSCTRRSPPPWPRRRRRPGGRTRSGSARPRTGRGAHQPATTIRRRRTPPRARRPGGGPPPPPPLPLLRSQAPGTSTSTCAIRALPGLLSRRPAVRPRPGRRGGRGGRRAGVLRRRFPPLILRY